MKTVLIATLAITILAAIVFLLRKAPESSVSTNQALTMPDANSLESKLAALAACGIRLSNEFTVDNLLESWDREAFEEPGFNLVLVGLGMCEEHPPWRPHCRNLWHFDTECIEGDGSYCTIAERMAAMAGDALPLSKIADHVDIEKGKAWLRFECRGKEYTIQCDVDNDWVDTKIFGRFVELLSKLAPDKLFVYYDLGGQDCIIGCVNLQQYDALRKLLPKLERLS